MAALEVALRTVLAVVFGVAFVSKVRSPDAFRQFADSLGDIGWLRGRRRSAVAAAIPVLEAGTVLLLAVNSAASWGFSVAAILLAAFTAVTAREVARGHRVRCRCFGAGSAQIGPAQIFRNVVLLAASAAGLAVAPASHGGTGAAALVYAFGLALLAALALVRWDDLVYLAGS
jgi:Methylamine utilisation protein MauE